MTLLIVFLSVTNIALGYGLAIYLGYARAPWVPYKRLTSYRPPASGEKSPESRDDTTGTIGQENDENNDESAAEAVAEAADELAPEVSAEQEVLDNLETIREEIHEQPEPPTVEEALATETESSIPESATPESPDEQETASSATVADEELMQGIGEFQEQLKTQQEHSKLHAVNDTSKDQS